MSNEQKIALEKLVDSYGIAGIIEALTEITYEKSEHIRSNWQDEKLAKAWDKKTEVLNNAQVKLHKLGSL